MISVLGTGRACLKLVRSGNKGAYGLACLTVSMHYMRKAVASLVRSDIQRHSLKPCDEHQPLESAPARVYGRSRASRGSGIVVTWLILPVVICLSQRLSHACLSINKFVL